MAKFFWDHKEKDKRIHWMSWSKLSLSKAQGGMGFRDLSCFKKAMLAKQVWRLWKTPDSLIAKIMKAKYFPDDSILEAPLGKKPSFAWRSIHGSRNLLKEGLLWRVGNGKTIRIWKDKWLPTPITYRVQSPPNFLPDNATVSNLIDADTKWWKMEWLEMIFSKEDMVAIQSIPISTTDQADVQIWRGTKNGVFSVRSAYHMQKEKEMEQTVGGSRCTNKSSIWTNIWQLNLPCNTPSPLRLGLSPFFFYNKILQRSIRSIRVLDFSKSTINV
jgi:hypothetical protein